MIAQHRGQSVRLGRPSASPHVMGPRRLLAGRLMASLPAPAPARDWLAAAFSKAPGGDLGVMLNDSLGDCTCAALGHAIQVWTANNGTMETPSDSAILSAYETVDGYDPAVPSTDQGGVETVVLQAWQIGIAGLYKLVAWIPVNPQNHDHVMKAIERFGLLYRGLSLPKTIQNQPTNWTVDLTAGADAEAGSLGGHAVISGKYDGTGIGTVTWGYEVTESWSFNDAYCDEAYAPLCALWTPGGISPLGDTIEALQVDLGAVA
jgi:hypothetical protein